VLPFLVLVTTRHIVPTDSRGRAEEPSAGLQAPPERLGLDEQRERALAVDLDDRDRGAVGRLQLLIPADVDALEVSCTDAVDDLERRLTEVAPVRVIDGNSRDRAPA
jgi:hypothetical protein